jgi:hypothetical protein
MWLHLLGGLLWFVVAMAGSQLGRRLSRRSEFDFYDEDPARTSSK